MYISTWLNKVHEIIFCGTKVQSNTSEVAERLEAKPGVKLSYIAVLGPRQCAGKSSGPQWTSDIDTSSIKLKIF